MFKWAGYEFGDADKDCGQAEFEGTWVDGDKRVLRNK